MVDHSFDSLEEFLAQMEAGEKAEQTLSDQEIGESSEVICEIDDVAGTIKAIVEGKNYEFITGSDGKDYFFHRRSLTQPKQFANLEEGMTVRFSASIGEKGLIAKKVIAVPSEIAAVSEVDRHKGDVRSGRICQLVPEKGYCFIEELDGERHFAHVSGFRSPLIMTKSYRDGALLEFRLSVGDDGRSRAVDIAAVNAGGEGSEVEMERVYSGTVKRIELTYGFVHCDDIGDMFFHKEDFVDVSEWNVCFVGLDIEFRVRKDSEKGGLRACGVRLTSRM